MRFFAPPFPDIRHGPTLLHGCLKRFCANPPDPDPKRLRRLKRFVRLFVKRHFKPLPPDADVSLETWLAGTNYTEARKQELRDAWAQATWSCSKADVRNNSFGKAETYLSYKPARGINSRADRFKCFSGPYFKLIEAEVYQHRAFIKHEPVRTRPQYIRDMLGHFPGPYYETDYSQFEKHFTPQVLEACEFQLYEHMLQHHKEAWNDIRRVMVGTNVCKFKHFTIKIRGRRMSGEMCTSLGNGFTNLMLASFVAYEKTGRLDSLVGVVEGDDGLFATSAELHAEDFKSLGFDIKILSHSNLLRTSFCGIVMSDDYATMTDPRSVLLNFGWSCSRLAFGKKKTRDGLLRAKALSLAYEHPSCPVLSALAQRGLVLTQGAEPSFDLDSYKQQIKSEIERFKDETRALLLAGPSEQTRKDFATQFGVPVELQLRVEREIACCGEFLEGPGIAELMSTCSADCWDYRERFTWRERSWPFVA